MIALAAVAYLSVSGECIADEKEKLAHERLDRDRDYKEASAQFPEFCRHWQQDLREREQANRKKLEFEVRDGFQTATYTGYGEIELCEVHQSKEGFAIGKIAYREFVYYLAGRTLEEALVAERRRIGETHTTEIFRWEDGKWFQ